MEDDSMPPRPECEFDFNLPHEDETDHDAENQYLDCIEQDIYHHQSDSPRNSRRIEEHMAHANTSNLHLYEQDSDERNMNPGIVAKASFHKADAEAGPESFQTGYQTKKSHPKGKKSPRRFSDNVDYEVSPRAKKQRQSLFRDSLNEGSKEQLNLKSQGPGIGHRMLSLNLEKDESRQSPFERHIHSGLSLASSDGGIDSRRRSPALSEDSLVIPPDDRPAYELRMNIERKKAFTYIDDDTSGNFDPAEELKQKMRRLNKAKVAKATQQKKGKGKENVMKCIVKLHFKAFGNVRNYTNDEDNWPDDWSDIDTDFEREVEEFRNFYRRNTPNREIQRPIEDPRGDVDDLTGYPAARGCRLCRKHDRACSMTKGGTYPCIYCNENECEPIIPPTIKGRCKKCAENDKDFCSFEDDSSQKICDYCADNQYICNALPPDGYKAKRIDIYEIIGGEDRQHVQCTTCRQKKKRCSLKKKSDSPPCKYCKKHKIGCTFFNSPKSEPRKSATNDKFKGPTESDAPGVPMPGSDYFTAEDLADIEMRNNEDYESRSPTPEIEMEDNVGHKGILTKIRTSFAHPIQFGAPDQEACNFCEMPLFGFTGYFEREVHVIRWYNGLGFSEVGGGHCEDKGQTSMCEVCTTNRLQIMVCPNHEIESIFDDDCAQDFNFDAVAEGLISAEPSSSEVHYQLQRWCSMCFSVATHGCASLQPSLRGEEAEENVIRGCGLRLCNRCDVNLREEFAGDVDLMASKMEKKEKINAKDELTGDLEGKARADVGFLCTNGLLFMNASSE